MFELLTESPVVFVIVVFLFALLIGSFLNVVIHRLPIMMERDWRQQAEQLLSSDPEYPLPHDRFDLVVPRSRCPNCGSLITALQNVPVISYLFLRGRCANCSTKISPRYPIVEFATALLAAATAWHFGPGWEALAAVLLTITLVAVAMIDADTQLIPDSIALPLVWIGLTLSLFHPLAGATTLFISPSEAIIGALAGYLTLWSVFWLFKLVTGKDGMGYGDFKLLAALGAWLGWQQLPIIIMMSAVVGVLVNVAMIVFRGKDRTVPIPFGPYLAGAGWITMLWGETIKNNYLDLML